MIHSMTAFASRTGATESMSWIWEVRGVNARGLDLRLRLPEGIAGLEAAVRGALTASLKRGNVALALRLNRNEAAQALALDLAQLDRVLTALDTVQDRAFGLGVTLGQPTAADVLTQRGVVALTGTEEIGADVIAALLDDLARLVADFVQSRQNEGAALGVVIAEQLDRIEGLVAEAAIAAEARLPQVRANLTAALRRVVDDVPEIDPARVAQELALLAVKSDITEEIDRLRAHAAAGRKLLQGAGPIGRKLDFLAQEFNREANTLCAKAGDPALTAIGLDLKAVIDQLREQVQNVE